MSHWKRAAVPVLLALTACTQQKGDDAGSPPPSALPGPALDSFPLPVKLARMQSLLDDALAHGITRGGSTRFVAVKLLADRLLEVPPPFAWLTSGYYTESKLLQIQALADRLLSELRRNDVDEPAVLADMRQLRTSIVRLRGDLARGGGPAPPSLDSLLRQVPRTEGVNAAASALEE